MARNKNGWRFEYSRGPEDSAILITIALKSTGVGISFWNKWFFKKGNADEIETTSHLSFTFCLSEFIYAHWRRL